MRRCKSAAAASFCILRGGDPATTLADLARETGARALFFNRSWQPDERHSENQVRSVLQNILEVNDFPADCLHEPESLLSAAGEPLRVFTPFWRACRQRSEPAAPLPLPRRWTPWSGPVRSEELLEWRLRPTAPDWAGGLHERWQQGRTGYPLVDAGMRELLTTGWMHNRVRMTAASFLVKHLLIDWREGLRWFNDTLVDADQAANAVNWQWVAGCGADAAPWFRIFNPVLQGQKFDPQGEYVKQWLPELAQLPARHVHAPWRAPASVLRAAGIRLGSSYPRPMVDHDLARDRALTAWRTLQQRSRAPAMETRGR